MFGLDERIAALGTGDALLLIAGVAILLGLRHATDPDHLTALSTLVAAEPDHTPRRAGILGLAWGLGHATTLFVFGLPIVLFDEYLPEPAVQAAEALIGVLIVALAARLLLRWRRGGLHVHSHQHGTTEHRHVHAHMAGGAPSPLADAAGHDHAHPAATRSPLSSYGIGLVHGVGGSAGVGILLLASVHDKVEAVVALFLFALFTAVSMTLASTAFGYTLARGPIQRSFATLAPVLGAVSLAFGVWYGLGAVEAVPYYF